MEYKMTVFNEQLVKVKKTPMTWVSLIALFVVAAAIIALGFIFLFGTELMGLFILIVAGVCVGVWYMLRFFSIEYEYSLTNSCLDIDKIYARQSRKQYITLNLKTMEEMALITEPDAKDKVYSIPRGKVYNCSSNSDPYNTYYAIFNTKSQGRICLLFEPNEKMLDGIKLSVRSKIRTSSIHISEGK